MANEDESIMSNSMANNSYESVTTTTTTTTTNHDMTSVSGSFNDSRVRSFRSASKSSHFKENSECTVKKSKSRSRSRSRLRTRVGSRQTRSARYDNRRFDYESSTRNTHSLRHRLSYNYRPEHQRQHRQQPQQHRQHHYQPYYHNNNNNNNHHYHHHQHQNFQNYYHQEYNQHHSDTYNRPYQACSRARSPLPPPPNSDLNDQVSENRVLAVFGLDLKATDDDLNAVFKRYGCTSCRVIRNNRMGASKGYGFVYFDSIEEAVIAKRYTHGLRILSKEIRVDYSLGVRDPLTNRISPNATFVSPDSTSNPIANRLPHTTRQYATNEFSSSTSSTQIYNTHSPEHSHHHQPSTTHHLRDYSPHRSPANSTTNINTNFLQACMPLLLLHACKLLN